MAEPQENIVEVRFNGQRFGFWQKVNIRMSVDDLAASINLSLVSQGASAALGLDANTVAEVLINDVLVATVRADSVRRTVDKNSHSISLQARSLGRELIDCQYSMTLKGIRLGEIVKRICTLFKVPVKVPQTTAIVPDFSMQAESPSNAILNAARASNMLIYPTPDGGLMMTEPSDSAPVATLVMGEQIKSYVINDEYKLRFSEYYVKSFDYDANTSRKGAVVDAGLTYFRPMHIVADRHGNGLGALQRRAELERNRRLARAHSIELALFGWGYTTPAGKFEPWRINTNVRVVIPDEGIDEVFLIGDGSYEQDDQQGTVTNLTVMNRLAFVGEVKQAKKHSAAYRKYAQQRKKDAEFTKLFNSAAEIEGMVNK
jgi:prophage tail gpP-like protein